MNSILASALFLFGFGLFGWINAADFNPRDTLMGLLVVAPATTFLFWLGCRKPMNNHTWFSPLIAAVTCFGSMSFTVRFLAGGFGVEATPAAWVSIVTAVGAAFIFGRIGWFNFGGIRN